MTDKFRLPANLLTPELDPADLGFSDTSELAPLEGLIGQGRAAEALEFGLRMESRGFNIYVSGPAASGRSSIARAMATRAARLRPSPVDWCFVNNFQDPNKPHSLSLPPGRGRAFKEAMAQLIQSLCRDIQKLFESTKHLEAKAKIEEETQDRKKALFEELAEFGRERGYGFKETPGGFQLLPLRADRPMTEKEMAALTKAEREEIARKGRALDSEIREFQVRLHALDHESDRRLRDLDREVVQGVLEARLEPLRRSFGDLPRARDYLRAVHEDILANYGDFLPPEPAAQPPAWEAESDESDLTRYEVNLVVEHRPDGGAPVVEESNPTYSNLVGNIERKVHLGVVYTDFTQIRAGALLQASGGYLILNGLDLLSSPFSWNSLKRVLRTGEVKIEEPEEVFGFSTTVLRPQAVPVDVKVILVGPAYLFQLLQAYDEDFQKIFKVKADFDIHVPRDRRQDRLYACFVARLCDREGLPHFTSGAVAEVIRYACRLAERNDRLSLRLGFLADVVREAGFKARQEGRSLASASDVESAVAGKRYRSSLPEEWVQDEIRDGTLIVNVEGEAPGQVNGLSLYWTGDYAFGCPCRITARTFVGTKGVIDIQREAELGGNVHSKGVLTLSGFLAGKFAASHPFALSATLAFEQTYSEIDGDSAAAAELIALLASLADVPVRQYLAITGSVNQLGEIQPVGGVNEKIEGFFESCKRSGLTGLQGVVIPARNTRHLALRQEVVEAVQGGRFGVYAVRTVDEAVELLTGMAAGERGAGGKYPENSVYGRAALRLEEMARLVAAWGETKKDM
jgi:predicted ATP-dependent protease